jgi:3-hydroxyisobutyrate dehydrogenase-like beta-hydroxyacid dehydrogenase
MIPAKREKIMAQEAEKIGFVGIGLMGHGMAKNIVDKGHPLTVYARRDSEALTDLKARGATQATSLAELARSSSIIFLCLTDSPTVASVIAGLKPGLARGSVIVDCSTSDPVVTEQLAAELAEIGVSLADAPLGRTPKEAWAGTLDAMVGAEQAVFDRIAPVIAAWAGKTVHIGGVADGHRMKLLNNFLSLGYAALYAEALSLARKTGITVETFDKVIRGGRMDCGFYQTFMGYALEGNREAHKFTLSNAYKDMRYVEAMANDARVTTTMATAVKNSFSLAMTTGGDGSTNYVPHLVDFIAKSNGIET